MTHIGSKGHLAISELQNEATLELQRVQSSYEDKQSTPPQHWGPFDGAGALMGKTGNNPKANGQATSGFGMPPGGAHEEARPIYGAPPKRPTFDPDLPIEEGALQEFLWRLDYLHHGGIETVDTPAGLTAERAVQNAVRKLTLEIEELIAD